MDFITLIFGTYAISLALTQADGPFGIIYKIRTHTAVENFGALGCFLCTAFWVALALCLITGNLSLLFIAWGGAIIIDKVVE